MKTGALLCIACKFLWGAAFSAHQVEGGNDHSDWWDWEQSGHIENNQTTAIATDHYHRYAEDFALAQKLGLNVVRFSVAWSRIEPEQDVFDNDALAHYQNVISDLRSRGIIPVVTLHHFTHPQWFHALGGWTNPRSAQIFARFAEKCAEAFYPNVPIWITFNEPMVEITEGYLKGSYPPGVHNFNSAVTVFENLVAAHALAAQAIHKHLPANTEKLPIYGVGLALDMNAYDPAHDSSTVEGQADLQAIDTLSQLLHWSFLNAVQTGELTYKIPSIPALQAGYSEDIEIPNAKHSLDWVGVNYYSHYLIARDPSNALGIRWITPPDGLTYPQGLSSLLTETSKHLTDKIPLVVSENGVDDGTDSVRTSFIQAHLASLHQAISHGVDVRGYWYWSLTDNFEWLRGFGPRFGLIAIDYDSLKRTIRSSALWYRDFIAHHMEGP